MLQGGFGRKHALAAKPPAYHAKHCDALCILLYDSQRPRSQLVGFIHVNVKQMQCAGRPREHEVGARAHDFVQIKSTATTEAAEFKKGGAAPQLAGHKAAQNLWRRFGCAVTYCHFA